MPNLPAHIELARIAAQRLANPTLEANMGYFLLGSTSPDIRVITRGRREDYHFATLDFAAIGAGVEGLFHSHPHLLSSASQDEPTRAFVAGYITHLIADETWIVNVYRPYFGNRDVFADNVLGDVMDRAIQLELDRQAWDTAESSRSLLRAAANGIDLGFIPPATLLEWRDWVSAFIERGFSWDRLSFMARRIARGDEAHPAHRVAEEFVRTMPGSLQRLFETVPHRELADFKEQTVESLVSAVGEYLS